MNTNFLIVTMILTVTRVFEYTLMADDQFPPQFSLVDQLEKRILVTPEFSESVSHIGFALTAVLKNSTKKNYKGWDSYPHPIGLIRFNLSRRTDTEESPICSGAFAPQVVTNSIYQMQGFPLPAPPVLSTASELPIGGHLFASINVPIGKQVDPPGLPKGLEKSRDPFRIAVDGQYVLRISIEVTGNSQVSKDIGIVEFSVAGTGDDKPTYSLERVDAIQ